MKIGLIGPSGQLGSAISRHREVSEIGFDMVSLDRAELDLEWSAFAIDRALRAFDDVDIVINAAAYTAVDAAESNLDKAIAINGKAPEIIALYCKKMAIPLIHISTDYVFEGTAKTPYHPSDAANPESVYGQSKHIGEINIQASGCSYAILRTSWLYDSRQTNFFTTMLQLSKNHDTVRVVNDQFGRPTFADELARAVIGAAKKMQQDPLKYSGLYHVTDIGSVISWADFAREIFRAARPHINKEVITKNISSTEYNTSASRPAYSALDTSLFEKHFNIQLKDWQLNLKAAIVDWNRNKKET